MEENILNAQIETANIVCERDHALIYLRLQIKLQDSGVICLPIGLGTYGRDYTNETDEYLGSNYYDYSLLTPIFAMLCDIVEVSSLKELEGKYIRVKTTGIASGTKIVEIGNLMKDKWFSLEKFYKIRTERKIYNSIDYISGYLAHDYYL